ncbi:MAG: class I SAM-dependent methyltransferase [Pseudomonadota bacterium]
MTDTSAPFVEIFNDPDHAAQYACGPARFMPGFHAVHQMAGVLIREQTAADATVLVHGAGGGLELEALATANAGWRFVGVDPAAAMLEQARQRLGALNERVTLHHGFIDDAPIGPFDAATSFLTLHFLPPDERRRSVADIVRRLKPGAPFIAAHCSFPQSSSQRDAWLARHQAYTIASGVDVELAERGRKDIAENLVALNPDEDEAILRAAGLANVTLFYSAFTWRGWFGHAK